MDKFEKRRYFSKPAHEIWESLGRTWIENPVDLRTMRDRVRSGFYTSYGAFLNELYRVYDNSISFNKNAPPGSEGAEICAAADACIWEVVVPWADSTLDIMARCEAEGLAKAIAVRNAERNQKREAEAEAAALAKWNAEEAKRRQNTVSSLLAELEMVWPGTSTVVRDAPPGPAAAPSADALLLSAQGCPMRPPRSLDSSLNPHSRLALIEEQLAMYEHDKPPSDHLRRLCWLSQTAVAEWRTLGVVAATAGSKRRMFD